MEQGNGGRQNQAEAIQIVPAEVARAFHADVSQYSKKVVANECRPTEIRLRPLPILIDETETRQHFCIELPCKKRVVHGLPIGSSV